MKTHTILWADDDQDDLLLFTQVLEEIDQNFHIIEVENGKEALCRLEQMKQEQALPCLIILDINMPVLNGRETLVKIKEDPELQSIPVVVLTTSSSKMDTMFCERYGARHFMKPPVFTEIKGTLKTILNYCTVDKTAFSK